MTTFARNAKAFHDFHILKHFEAGIELLGTEAKAIRAGKISLRGAFVAVRGSAEKPEAYLLNANIEPYQPKNTTIEYDALRARKLLLSRKELTELREAEATSGLTIVPLLVYNKSRFLKVEVAIAKGKKEFDKRQAIKKRDTERELKRSL